jgi:hypothetical protein
MRTVFVTVALLSFSATSAFALGETNCSNEDGSIQRVEEEIWGANPVYWSIDGTRFRVTSRRQQDLSPAELRLSVAEVFDESTRVVLESSTEPAGLRTHHEKYQIEVDLVTADRVLENVLVTCVSWSNAAID